MANLYEISEEFKQALDELTESDLPEDAIADTLEGMKGAFEKKAVNVGMYIANLEGEAMMIDLAIKRMADRKKSLENRAKRYRDYLIGTMRRVEVDKCSNEYISVRLNAPRQVVSILNEDLIPAKYIVETYTKKPDKVNLLRALKSGEEIEGAIIDYSPQTVTIK